MSNNDAPLTQWLARLESFSPHEIELGLERVVEVLERLRLPPPKRVFHIAGTNGKGSSVAFLEALMLEAGMSVGAYTSPHVNEFNERIRLNGVQATDDQLVEAFERVDEIRRDTPLTYFEFGTLAAMVVFDSAGIENVILEVGMGGRLDAVNAIEPVAGLITNVSLDHCDWLGDDVETIAGEKAGIMRPGKPLIYASQPVPARVTEIGVETGATLSLAGSDYRVLKGDFGQWHWIGRDSELRDLDSPSLKGDFQIDNAAGVLALVESAGISRLLDPALVNRAFAKPALAGRLQQIDFDGQWLLDVAHNPAAAAVVAQSLASDPVPGKTIALVAMLDDKDVEGVVLALDSVVDDWIAVTADSPRAIDAATLGHRIREHCHGVCRIADSLTGGLRIARESCGDSDRVLVTGSFYIVGPALVEIYSRRASV